MGKQNYQSAYAHVIISSFPYPLLFPFLYSF